MASSDDRRALVIGSGPAGSMAALTLLKHSIPVTMLESGQSVPGGLLVRAMGKNVYRRRPKLGSRIDHVATGDPDARWTHTLEPGGLSNYWTGAVPRFATQDFTEGERLHERYRWPISYDELAPYYDQVEREMRVVGGVDNVPNLPAPAVGGGRHLPGDWRRVATGAERFGHGLVPLPLAAGPEWHVARGGTAFNSFTRIVRRLRGEPHFELLLGAHVLRLEWSGSRRRVTSVMYFDRAARTQRRAIGAAVVVAAGALASTKLLMDSDCHDFPEGLGNTEGLLGRYLHDHPHDWWVLEVEPALSRLSHAAYLTRAPYAESPPLLAASSTLGNTSTVDKVLAVTRLRTKTFGVNVFGTVVPEYHNHVSLWPNAKDEFSLPLLDLHIRYGDDVPKTMATARQRVLEIVEAAGHRATVRWSQPEFVPGTSVHYGGTVRMHRSPQHGMLNAWNRLHAVSNVVVADASAFTTGVEKNPALTLAALAARAAARLADDLKRA